MIERLRCVVCGVTDTPLWRSGPKGPKTLCNACGVRWKKGKLYVDGNQVSPPQLAFLEKTIQKRASKVKLGTPIDSLSILCSPSSSSVRDQDVSKLETFLKTPTAAAIAYAASRSLKTRFRDKVVTNKETEKREWGNLQDAYETSCFNEAINEREKGCWYFSGQHSDSDTEFETTPALIELDTEYIPSKSNPLPETYQSGYTRDKWTCLEKNSSRHFLKKKKDSKSMRRQTEYNFGLLLDAAKAVGMMGM